MVDNASLVGLVRLENDLGQEEIERGFQRLMEFNLSVNPEVIKSSNAKDRWSAIAKDAEGGTVTFIERRGVSLVVLPASKLIEMAAKALGKRTMGDIIDTYPGVEGRVVPRANSRGGPVRSLKLPEGEPIAK